MQQQQANDLQAIITRSGGDCDKLTLSDKDHLVKDIAHGDEQTAKMLLTINTPRNVVHQRPTLPPQKQ